MDDLTRIVHGAAEKHRRMKSPAGRTGKQHSRMIKMLSHILSHHQGIAYASAFQRAVDILDIHLIPV